LNERKIIFHLSFDSFHLSFVSRVTRFRSSYREVGPAGFICAFAYAAACGNLPMTNEKWKMTNGKWL